MAPEDFDAIADLVAEWGLPTPHERFVKRARSSMAEIQAFHRRIEPQVGAIVAFLNQYPLDRIPDEHLPLAYTALAAIEVDDAVNIWKNTSPRYADDIAKWETKSSFYA
ncbi:hypothetical protein [Sphingomonas flavalba]|uniref:hypothetical protein n=1 Tax=Sphingomonas flavalba TaxID=2559804 RepID=UPI00109DF16C|nr:hypothetical protein [Sphingomonas flavalba]